MLVHTLQPGLRDHRSQNSEEAVEAVVKKKPDLVLLDVNMPGIGGIAACREIPRIVRGAHHLCSRFETRSGQSPRI